jgi:geranylgeranyl diphosphate synthase type II
VATDASNLVSSVLHEYGQVVRRELSALLDRESARDPLYRLARDYPLRGGRSLRASLCIAAARAFGASLEQAVASALSLELWHNAFLVHDDVEDESEERRGKPTLHVLHGVPTAINVGDALAVLGLGPLLANEKQLGAVATLRILQEAERMARETVEGQATELRWREQNTLELRADDYLRMILKKTCWYTTIYPCRAGALIGAGGGLGPSEFVRFGFFLGAAFQIQDDALNLVGDKATYGKEIAGDILEGKRTLMLIHLFQHATSDERSRLSDLFSVARSARTDADIVWVCDAMRRHDAIGYAREVAHGLAGAAQHEFEIAFRSASSGRDRDFIECLPRWMLERT